MNNKTLALLIAIIVVAFFFGGMFFFSNGTNTTQVTDQNTQTTGDANTNSAANETLNPAAQNGATNATNPTSLQITDVKVGTGATATSGKTVTVNYVGTLTDGTKFDASADHGGTFSFVLGGGQVIKGWDLGVAGMKVGGTRKLVIPPSLGYGAQGIGSIPPNSTLVFTVDLISVK